MTTDGTAMMGLLDQRLDALDRALLGLVPRSARISMVAEIEKRLREKQEGDPAEFEVLAALPEVASASATTASRESAVSHRKRSRLALSSGILGIVALSLMFLLPVTYVVIASVAEMIGEIPAISLIVMNVLAVAGLGTFAGVLSLAAIVRLGRSKKRARGLGWAITGLCTSPMPALAGLLATVFFVLPMTMEYASNATRHSGDFEVASMPVSFPPPVDCSNGVCVPPPPFDAGSHSIAFAPPLPPPPVSVPYAPATTGGGVAKAIPVTEVKAESTSPPPLMKEETAPVGARGEAKPETSVAPMGLPPAGDAKRLP